MITVYLCGRMDLWLEVALVSLQTAVNRHVSVDSRVICVVI